MKTYKASLIIGAAAWLCSMASAGFAQDSQEDLVKILKQQAEQIRVLQEEVLSLKAAKENVVDEAQIEEMVETKVEAKIEETESSFSDQLGDIWENLQRVQIHGYVSQGFLYSTDNNYLLTDSSNGEFEFNEMAINFSANLADDLNVGLQLFSRDQGEVGNNAINLDWAYADYRFRDWLGVRAGIMKIPHGLYNETRDLDIARTSIILPQGVYEDQFREVRVSMMGLGLYGEIPMESAGSLSYQAIAGSQAFDDSSGGYSALWEEYGVAENYESEVGFTSAGQLIWNTPLDGLRVGGSYYYADKLSWEGTTINGRWATLFGIVPGSKQSIDFSNWVDLIGSIEYTWNDLTLAAEYRKKTADMVALPFGAFDEELEGYYVRASYRFNDWFELGGYYSHHAESYVQDLKENDIAITTRFDITDNWIAKLELHHLEGTQNSLDNLITDQKEENWWLVAAKVTFSF